MAERAKERLAEKRKTTRNETQGGEKKIHKAEVEEDIWFSESVRLHFEFGRLFVTPFFSAVTLYLLTNIYT